MSSRDRLPLQVRAGAWRIAWIVLAVAGMAAIYPFRSSDNAEEVAAAQALVDAMSEAHDSVTVGDSDIGDFTLEGHGFAGFAAVTPGGVPAEVLLGRSGENCIVMHWTAPRIAQVGRLVDGQNCQPARIAEVPVRPNDGYVPGTGPPFDVTPLIYKARTPFWFMAALVVLIWVTIKAALDLFLIALRPDHFFSDE